MEFGNGCCSSFFDLSSSSSCNFQSSSSSSSYSLLFGSINTEPNIIFENLSMSKPISSSCYQSRTVTALSLSADFLIRKFA